ncbi:MAG: hypothetical protein GY934_17265, partial [Gammaproteobacteria bacterium]|nr:hypothetical protein [Gammaproteobacteria bacterium]
MLPVVVGLGLVVLVAGYMLETILHVRERYMPPLPNWWQYPGRLFTQGVRVMLIWGSYNAPALLVAGGAVGVNLVSGFLVWDAAVALGAVGIGLGCVQFALGLMG